MNLTEEDILRALRDCYDPELPVNIVDLGLVYAVKLAFDEDSTPAFPRQRVDVDLTMTSRNCPSHERIVEQVSNRLAAIQQIGKAHVRLVWDPPWTPSRISAEGRARLGIG